MGAVASAYFTLGVGSPSPACDIQLATEIGATTTGLCLRPLEVAWDRNSSDIHVPVLVMKPGTTGTTDILYNISKGLYVSRPGLKPNVTSTDVPMALSVVSAKVNKSSVGFSDGLLVFRNADWVVYRYTVNAAADSAGYYAILPRYYWGMYPALFIGANPNDLNTSSLSMWGYTGCCTSGEVTLPSSIVGTSGFGIVNATVPAIPYCPNAACNLVSRSLY